MVPYDPLETWLSGRKHLTANEAGFNHPPGFESLRLRRQNPLAHQMREVFFYEDSRTMELCVFEVRP